MGKSSARRGWPDLSLGNEPDPNRANYGDTDLGATSAVGCFPGGASPCGCEEMSGNVWEWTRSLFGDYPYPPEGPQRQGREDPATTGRRVLRGAARSTTLRRIAHCRPSFTLESDFRFDGSGFRVVVLPILSGR